jgi:hypothetical protein
MEVMYPEDVAENKVLSSLDAEGIPFKLERRPWQGWFSHLADASVSPIMDTTAAVCRSRKWILPPQTGEEACAQPNLHWKTALSRTARLRAQSNLREEITERKRLNKRCTE